MNTAHASHRPGRPQRRLRRGRLLLISAGLATALLASGCDTAGQVPWASYNSQLQQRIDAAAGEGESLAHGKAMIAAAANNASPAAKARNPRLKRVGAGKKY